MQEEETVVDDAYEVRFGWRRLDLIAIPGIALLAGFFVWVARDDRTGSRDGARAGRGNLLGWLPEPAADALAVGFAGFFALLLVLMLAGRLAGRVALRVDAAGITLGLSAPWPRSWTAVVPWSEVRTVYLWRPPRTAMTRNLQYIGLRRRKGSGRMPGLRRLERWQLRRAAPRDVPVGVVDSSRMVEKGRVDRERLAEAIARFAPRVELIDRW